MNGMVIKHPQFIIKDIAIDQLQILDYRSKRKNIQFKESESNVAYVIHPKLKKQFTLLSLW